MDYQAQLEAFAAGNRIEPQPVQETLYGIFNDPEFFEPRFASGEIHPHLREKILDEPLWTSDVAGAAKRFMLYNNEIRARQGTLHLDGMLILREQVVLRHPWRDIKDAELDAIDEGRRASR
jgi:hypothetical protein